MVTNVNFSLFPSNELFTFAKGTLSLVQDKTEQTPAISPFVGKLSQTLTIYQSALERERTNPFTQLLITADAERDDSYYAFRTYVEAVSFRNKEGWNTASDKLLEIIRKHGWSTASMGYKAETAALTNIISEIKTKCTAELELIGASEWLSELEASQLAYENMFQQSITNTPTDEPTVWGSRPDLTNALRSLFSMISLLQIADPTDELNALKNALNELIIRSVTSLKAAETRAENERRN